MRELLIVGAGIAGLNAAIAAARRGSNHVTLIDTHTYQTLAPQLARGAAGLAAFSQMALMLPESDRQLTRICASVTRIDPMRKLVVAGDREYTGDKLIIAVGRGPARGPAAGDVHRPYTAEAASRLRLAWHGALAAAANRRPLPGDPIRLAVVGGGAFGCELALSFATMRPFACERYGLPSSVVEIRLYEAASRVVPDWPQRASDIMSRELYLSEVETRLACRVTGRSERGLVLEDGDEQQADIVIWACGRAPNQLLNPAAMPLDTTGSLSVDEFLRLDGYGDVYAVGDCAAAGCGWDWALVSARAAAANAASRLPRKVTTAPVRRRFVNLPLGRVMSLRGARLAANTWQIGHTARLLAERRVVGGLALVLQAWPSPTPDHSLAAWRDASERRRGRHAERRF